MQMSGDHNMNQTSPGWRKRQIALDIKSKGKHMTHDEVIAAWNNQADYMNKWERLGEDEKLEWAMKLEREACAKVCDELSAPDIYSDTDKLMWDVTSMDCATAIRARGQA
jgi:hypothetical protein